MNLLELHNGLVEGRFTSVQLVEEALKRIRENDSSLRKLNSIAEINPNALFIARRMDYELQTKGARGILHGIPVVVKDNISVKDEMHTTAGSYALNDLITTKDAKIIENLKKQGAVIIAKANLSEFAYWMSTQNMPSGYSSRGGQVVSPYKAGYDPSGSSSGSAVAVAARFVPYSIGTETDGSLTSPSKNNAIVTIKPTIGLVSRSGIIPISHIQDTAGPMCTSVLDCAIVLTALAGYDKDDPSTLDLPQKDYTLSINKSINNWPVGLINFKDRKLTENQNKTYLFAKKVLEENHCEIFEITIDDSDVDEFECLLHEFKNGMERYLYSVNGLTNMKHLSDIIKFNSEKSNRCLKYGQDLLEKSDKKSGLLIEDEYIKMRKEVNDKAHSLTDDLINKYGLKCLITVQPSSVAPISGNPVLAIPADEIDERYPSPAQIQFIGKAFDEETLFTIASKFESELNLVNRPSWAKEFEL